MLSLGHRARFVLGNADRWFLDVYDGRVEPEHDDAWLLEQLDATHREFFAALPRRVAMNVDGLGSVLFCHGSPRSEDEIITAITAPERLTPMLEDVNEQVVVCGHTHKARLASSESLTRCVRRRSRRTNGRARFSVAGAVVTARRSMADGAPRTSA
jgi:predicted phosphodiesterase